MDTNAATSDVSDLAVLRLLQLASATLPVGAYSYSEGLEFLVDQGGLSSATLLQDWIVQELRHGTIRMEAAMMLRAYQATLAKDLDTLISWNDWWSAARETEELRQQSWQMGRSLLRLLVELEDPILVLDAEQARPMLLALLDQPCNFAIVMGLAAALWQIPAYVVLLGYLHSWATNLVGAGIKLIPLGQTDGQKILLALQPEIMGAVQDIQQLSDEDLESCGWGLALASMGHETLYSRLFRS
ncbi:MAG TPA: urease accessory protein UreF [Stenomitos sp.]